jgi:4a-hydroxytetrahydrobiopterin dehydratase
MKYIKLFESDWSGKDKIVKEFSFKDFNEALDFVNKVAELSEEMNHHPEINWNYNKVKITLVTHDEGRVTQKDTDLSKRIDDIKKPLD